MKINVVTLDNKAAGELELSDAVFGLTPRKDILARVVQWQQAKARSGTHKTKTRAEVSVPVKNHSSKKAPAAPVKVRPAGRTKRAVAVRMVRWFVIMVIACRRKFVRWV